MLRCLVVDLLLIFFSFWLLWFFLFLFNFILYQLNPIMHWRSQEVKNKFRTRYHGFFADFKRKNLIQVVWFKFLILISIPQPNFSITTLRILFLFLWFDYCLRKTELIEKAFQWKLIHFVFYRFDVIIFLARLFIHKLVIVC